MSEPTVKELQDRIRELEAKLKLRETMPMKYRRMEFNAELEQRAEKAEAELAALRAGDRVLRPEQVNAILLSEYVRDRHGIERDCRIVEVAYAQGLAAALKEQTP